MNFFNPKSSAKPPVGKIQNPKWNAFTLIELLVVVAIIALLVGILLPALTRARQNATKSVCSANLRQIGMGIQVYQQNSNDRFPAARYMPPPFVSISGSNPLPEVLKDSLSKDDKVYHCPGDKDYVFKLCKDRNPAWGTSYTYNNSLSGQILDDTWFAKRLDFTPADIFVCYDCDHGSFKMDTGPDILVPSFHNLRNLLFADGHVGNYQ